jgi:hypothetical protein
MFKNLPTFSKKIRDFFGIHTFGYVLRKNVCLPYKAGIKSLLATLPDENFYWGICFLNRAFH